mgnify:CR=1 FL=1
MMPPFRRPAPRAPRDTPDLAPCMAQLDAPRGDAVAPDERTDAVLATHVASCAECRALDATWRRVARAYAAPDHAGAPATEAERHHLEALLTRTLARRAAGERPVLPVDLAPSDGDRAARVETSPRVPRMPLVARRRRALSAVAAALVAALAWSLLRQAAPADAGSTAGRLTLETRASGGAGRPTLAATYVPSSALARADSVRLDIRTWAGRDGGAPGDVRGWLSRRGDAFIGTVTLPAGTVLAQLVVTSPDGAATDDNDARRWEWLAADAQRRPAFEALWQQVALHAVDDWERARHAGLAMLRHYPASPTSVRFALGDALALAGPAAADSVRRAFARAARVAESAVARATAVDAETLGEMVFLAQGMRDTAMVRRWRARLLADAPTSAAATQQRVFAVLDRGTPPAATLAALDTLWREVGGAAPQLPYEAFGLARRDGSDGTLRTWGERLVRALPYTATAVADAWRTRAALRADAVRLLADRLAALPPGTRSVDASDADWRAALGRTTAPADRARQALLTQLAQALAADRAAVALRAAADTLARAPAPGHAVATLESDGVVRVEHARAREAVATRLRATIRARPLPGDPSLRGADGTAVTLRTRLARAASARDGETPRHALVAFVSRGCAPSLADLNALERVRGELAAQGVPVLALVAELPSPDVVRALAARGYRGPLAFDDRAQAARALRHVGTPEYVVLDLAAGTALASVRRADDAAALLAVLAASR